MVPPEGSSPEIKVFVPRTGYMFREKIVVQRDGHCPKIRLELQSKFRLTGKVPVPRESPIPAGRVKLQEKNVVLIVYSPERRH